MKIIATAHLHGHELNDLPVLNPGSWFGRTWLLELGGSYSPLFLVVEADSMSEAIDELAESEKYGHHIVVSSEDLDDYDPETCHYGPSGQVLDLDHLMIYGDETSKQPFCCRYFAEQLPKDGIDPGELDEYDLDEEAA